VCDMNLICAGLILWEEYAGNLGEKAAEHRGFPVDLPRPV